MNAVTWCCFQSSLGSGMSAGVCIQRRIVGNVFVRRS